MKVAVLILAAKAPRALAALAAYFAPSGCDLYVHVDLKTDLADYLRDAGPLPARVNLLETRRKVYWAGFSMIEATLDLVRAAVAERDYDRYVFISDDSFPVQSLDGFFARLAAAEDVIVCHPMKAGNAVSNAVLARYYGFHLIDSDGFDRRRLWTSPKALEDDELDLIARLLALKARGKRPLDLYHGHASWTLSHESIRLTLDVVESDPWLIESCRFSAHSDEFFFQSIVGAAKSPQGLFDSPTYADSVRFHPRVIRTARDLPLDVHPHFLFLRKIAPDFEPGLPEACLRLFSDLRRRLAQDPDLQERRVLALADGETRGLHLFAPARGDSGWGGMENLWGRRARRSRAEVCVWRLGASIDWPNLKLTLPCAGADAPFEEAYFEINGRRAPLAPADVGYAAEFRDLAGPFDSIALHTRPGGDHGFLVATMPEA